MTSLDWHLSRQQSHYTYTVYRVGGSARLRAYIGTRLVAIGERLLGASTPATGTTAECSSHSPRGDQWAGTVDLTTRRASFNFTWPGAYTEGTATHGASGAQRASAV